MNNNSGSPFSKLSLDEEEKLIEELIKREEFSELPDFDDTKKILEEAAKQYIQLNTSKRVTIRIKQKDLIKVKARAKRNNIPYQTLLGAVIHDFAEERRELNIK